MNIKDFTGNLKKSLSDFKNAVPKIVAAEAVGFFKERFRQQAWQDAAVEPWAKRKAAWGKQRKSDQTRGILIKSGRLRRSIRAAQVSADRIVIATDVPYALAHNEGFEGDVVQNVRAHTRTKRKVGAGSARPISGSGAVQVRAFTRRRHVSLPKRQFMGASQTLETQLKKTLEAEFNRALK